MFWKNNWESKIIGFALMNVHNYLMLDRRFILINKISIIHPTKWYSIKIIWKRVYYSYIIRYLIIFIGVYIVTTDKSIPFVMLYEVFRKFCPVERTLHRICFGFQIFLLTTNTCVKVNIYYPIHFFCFYQNIWCTTFY